MKLMKKMTKKVLDEVQKKDLYPIVSSPETRTTDT